MSLALIAGCLYNVKKKKTSDLFLKIVFVNKKIQFIKHQIHIVWTRKGSQSLHAQNYYSCF